MMDHIRRYLATACARVACIRPYIAYVLLANLVFWLAGTMYDTLPRAAFNIDYVIVAALVPIIGVRIGVILMSLAVSADVWRTCASLYYFNASDALGSLAFLSQLSPVLVATYAVVGGSLVLLWSGAIVTFGKAPDHRSRVLPFSVIAVVPASVAVLGGNTSVRLTDNTETANVANSAAIGLIKTTWSAISSHPLPVTVQKIDSATQRVGWFQNAQTNRRLVLILVESWGLPKDRSWLGAETEPLRNSALLERYRMESGTVPFHGATVPGEFRELCGVSSGVVQRPHDESVLANCLPARTTLRGQKSLYLHPFDGFMFYRRQWVPTLGFSKVLFRRELLAEGIRKCDGPFAGACDDDSIRWIGDRLASGTAPEFTFLLTLNSHLPVSLSKDTANPLSCGTEQRFTGDESICELLTLIRRVNAAVAQVAIRADLPATEFLLVGDHAPPFLYKSRREHFSQTEVPYIHLIPKKG